MVKHFCDDKLSQFITIKDEKTIEEQSKLLIEKSDISDIFEAAFENVDVAIIIYDKNGEQIKLNRTARENNFSENVKKQEGENEKLKFYHQDGGKANFYDIVVKRILCGEKIENLLLMMSLPERDIRINVSGIPVFDKNGELYIGIVCSKDITEITKYAGIKRIEQQVLFEVEKERKLELERILTIKDEFLSVISHEFKTPLTVINSAIQTIEVLYNNETSPKVQVLIKKIKQNSFRQLRLVNNLLDITRANAGRININIKNHDIVFHTKAIIESVYLYSQQKGIKLTFSSRVEKMVIGIDEEKYERIFLNLISNAIKFTPVGKRIIVMLSNKKGFVSIKVKDEGIGIPKDKQNLIFERFGQVDTSLTRQAEGTGIGLSLVKTLVEAFGGTISVKSKVGKGSTFSLLLPSKKAQDDKRVEQSRTIADNRLIYSTAVEFSDIYL